MGKLDGKVAFITGAARGQGRSHAIRLAQEGAAIIAIDICAQIPSVPYPMSTTEDLEQTVKEVEREGGRIVARSADVRDVHALSKAFTEGVAELGPVDIVLANAGIGGGEASSDAPWDDIIAVNLTGVWNTGRVAIPSMIERGQGGSIVLTSSTSGFVGLATDEMWLLAYTASKHGVVGLMRSWANFCAPHNIRVNVVAPTGVRSPMVINDWFAGVQAGNGSNVSLTSNAMPVDILEAIDISNAIAWLVSDDARYVTGTSLPVDAGKLNKQ